MAKATGKLERVFVWGSFVTSKESPNDIDLLLLMRSDFEVEETARRCHPVFEHETLQLWLETYQRARDFKRRDIMEVLLA